MATIHTPEEYAKIYEILQKHDNSQQIINYIIDKILPKIDCNRFLDIGAGEGKITKEIMRYFDQTLAIEPNLLYVERLKNINRLSVINQNFQETTTLTQKYNFILCSHVLYHVAEKEWESFMLKAYDALTSDGVLMFIVSSDQGEHNRKCINYNPKYKCHKILEKIGDKHGTPYQVHISHACYTTKTLEEMYQICRFAILEDCFTQEMYQSLLSNGIETFNQNILNYAKHKRTAADEYSLIINPAFVTFRKL